MSNARGKKRAGQRSSFDIAERRPVGSFGETRRSYFAMDTVSATAFVMCSSRIEAE